MNYIKKYREDKNIQLWTLSKMVNVTCHEMQLIEDGQKKPNIYTITNICLALNKNRHQLGL